jgi:uncharacterized protein
MVKYMLTLKRWLGVILIACSVIPLPAAALDIPPLRGRVNDLADLIHPSTEQQLETALAQLEKSDSTQVVILTIPSLDGEVLEEYSMRVVEQWRIGQGEVDNGVLLLVSKNDRKIRIEVGYGLEGKLTDLTAGRIIRNVMVPQFKMGQFDQGIIQGVSAIVAVVRGEYTAPVTPKRQRRRGGGASPGLMGLLALFFFINMLSRIKRGVGAAAGGIMAPIAGAVFFKTGFLTTLLLIPVGVVAALLMGLLGGPLSFGHTTGYRGGRGHGGGFGGGGFGGGGFSGGGGGFGGGGASGGW